jgi:hypothetical protein
MVSRSFKLKDPKAPYILPGNPFTTSEAAQYKKVQKPQSNAYGE